MSNLCRPVEKITESLVGNINVKWSFGLAANDKRREGVVSPRTSSRTPVLVQRDLRPLLVFYPQAEVFLLPPVRHAGIHPDLQHEKVVNLNKRLKSLYITYLSLSLCEALLTFAYKTVVGLILLMLFVQHK